MKNKYNLFSGKKIIFLLLISSIWFKMSAQEWHVGDLYVFPDKSKGIVCYVDPKDSKKGWVAALEDIPGKYAIWTGATAPSGIATLGSGAVQWSWNGTPTDKGRANTDLLYKGGLSPAVNALKYHDGWYIPDALQLWRIYSLIPFIRTAFENNGGNAMDMLTKTHWSSTFENNTAAYRLLDASCSSASLTTKNYVRPVRDFGYEAIAYWEEPFLTDSTITASIKVSPKVVTTYDAIIVYGKDTFRIKSSAIPCHKYDKDTLYELVCRADTLYNSQKDSHFSGLDISVVKGDYDTYRDTLQTVKGCDSIITLKLLVVDNCENVYTDTLCPIETSYSILDTTFLPGTVSGIYARPGIKDVGGGLTIDTVSYINLTILTPPTVNINDMVETCPLVGSQVLGATITEGKAPYTYTWSTEGSGITLSDASIPAPTVTIPTKCGVSYTIKLDVIDDNGCKADQATKVVTVTSTNAPIINTTFASADLGCNPSTITAPTFTVTEDCEGTNPLPTDSVTVTGPTHTGCAYTQSWTAHYTDACGKKAKDSTITYTWTETTPPTIITSLTDKDFSCIAMLVAPDVSDFTVNDACNPSAMVTLTEGPETVAGYVHSKTWIATYKNSCDEEATPISITYKWKNAATVTITCPPDVYDTLDFGDCEMKIPYIKLGSPSTTITPSENPFGISNDFPADSIFAEGDHLITWVIVDSICGNTDTCWQNVKITFPECPDAVDCEGYIYHGVRIGCDCWTQRNLESTKYSDCTDIPCIHEYVSETHPNATENVDIYGRLYCYEAAIRDSADNGHGHIQGICPAGWYLPTPEKYEELNSYGTPALKYPSYWITADGINTTGFSALPAGFFNGSTGRFEGLLGETYFWSTSGTGASSKITVCSMILGCHDIIFIPVYTGMGYSVRCIKEKEK